MDLAALNQQAVQALQSGDLAKADSLIGQLLTARPGHPLVNYLLGALRVQQGRSAEALEPLEAAHRAKPDNVSVLLHMGNALQTLKRFDEAVMKYDLALKLKPDFKTIADFRRDNAGAIKQACRQFTMLCKEMGLFGGRLVGIDGSKYRAVNSKKRNFTEEKLNGLIKYVDKKVDEYLQTMDEMDSEEIDERKPTKEELTEKIEELRRRKQDYEAKKKVLEETGETQMSLTDPDSRLMKTKDGKNVCYNLQMAVDSKHKLIIAHEVINECNDQQQLLNMARRAKEVLGVEQIEVVADKGYWNGEQVGECDKEGITVYIPEKRTSSKEGTFSKDDFVYRANKDVYECPAKQELQYWYTHNRNGRDVRVYKGVACEGCEIRSKCTTSSTSRLVRRWPGEDALEKMGQRVRGDPDKMKLRGQLVEHPSGTLKRWWGYEQFLTKGLKKVAAESDLMILAYNIRRVINIEGTKKMIDALA